MPLFQVESPNPVASDLVDIDSADCASYRDEVSIEQVVDSTDKITAGISEVSSNTTNAAVAIEEQPVTMAGLDMTASKLQTLTSSEHCA